jgi:hypothetical protein
MLRSQASTLNETGLNCLAKANECTAIKDVTAFTELGMKCLEESRTILSGLRSNSILIFLECCARVEQRGNYGEYLDFCARNGLETLSEKDFRNLV